MLVITASDVLNIGLVVLALLLMGASSLCRFVKEAFRCRDSDHYGDSAEGGYDPLA